MALSLYDVGNWQKNTTYNIYDIYRYNGFYYTAIVKHNSGNVFNADYSDGVISYNGISRPYFFFLPSYSSNVDIKPLVKETRFGDSYSQRAPDGVSSILLAFNVIFDKRNDAQTRAILHFLHQRKSTESFVWIPPFPYNSQKLFTCPSWKHTTIFQANHSIDCQFIESVT